MKYTYRCVKCRKETEVSHSLAEINIERFCSCGSLIKRVPVSFALVGGKTLAQGRQIEGEKKMVGTKFDLMDKYGVHEVSPLRRGDTFDSVVRDIKNRGSFVRDKMQETTAKTAENTSKKQKEWISKQKPRKPNEKR